MTHHFDYVFLSLVVQSQSSTLDIHFVVRSLSSCHFIANITHIWFSCPYIVTWVFITTYSHSILDIWLSYHFL
jgi:hypothetical protein